MSHMHEQTNKSILNLFFLLIFWGLDEITNTKSKYHREDWHIISLFNHALQLFYYYYYFILSIAAGGRVTHSTLFHSIFCEMYLY